MSRQSLTDLFSRVGLRRRLAIALVSLTVSAAAIQGIGFWATEYWVERASLETLLERELQYLVEAGAPSSGDAEGGRAPNIRYYRPSHGGTVPLSIRPLARGWYSDVHVGPNVYQVLVRDLGVTDRVYLLYDSAPLRAREQRMIALFSLGVMVVTLLALWGARRLSTEALTPLARLVAEIRQLDPESRGARLSADGDPELRVISDALNGYMVRLDALIERERTFSAAASHELRTLLTVIGGAAELLLAGAPDPARPLARISRAVAQAQADLDALLALSRLRDSTPTSTLVLERLLPEWADLDASTTSIVWRLSPCTLVAPPGSVHMIFSNLLRNALRAAGAHGEVAIELTPHGLRVIDNGPGIPAHELPQVFEPHFRGRDGGTGIGLYVARALANRHGWKLTLDNRPEGGALAELRFANT